MDAVALSANLEALSLTYHKFAGGGKKPTDSPKDVARWVQRQIRKILR